MHGEHQAVACSSCDQFCIHPLVSAHPLHQCHLGKAPRSCSSLTQHTRLFCCSAPQVHRSRSFHQCQARQAISNGSYNRFLSLVHEIEPDTLKSQIFWTMLLSQAASSGVKTEAIAVSPPQLVVVPVLEDENESLASVGFLEEMEALETEYDKDL